MIRMIFTPGLVRVRGNVTFFLIFSNGRLLTDPYLKYESVYHIRSWYTGYTSLRILYLFIVSLCTFKGYKLNKV